MSCPHKESHGHKSDTKKVDIQKMGLGVAIMSGFSIASVPWGNFGIVDWRTYPHQ